MCVREREREKEPTSCCPALSPVREGGDVCVCVCVYEREREREGEGEREREKRHSILGKPRPPITRGSRWVRARFLERGFGVLLPRLITIWLPVLIPGLLPGLLIRERGRARKRIPRANGANGDPVKIRAGKPWCFLEGRGKRGTVKKGVCVCLGERGREGERERERGRESEISIYTYLQSQNLAFLVPSLLDSGLQGRGCTQDC